MRFVGGGTTNAFLVAVLAFPPLSRGDTPSEAETNATFIPEDDYICTFYLAPSSIPNAGFGVYTTKSFAQGSIVRPASAPSIAITDPARNQPDGETPSWPHNNYYWNPVTMGQALFEGHIVWQNEMTFGSLLNYHTMLRSVGPSFYDGYDDGILDRFKNAGAGAFSYYMGSEFVAKWRNIEAGEELFTCYGEEWLDDKEDMQDIPRKDDFMVGEEVLNVVRRNLEKLRKMTCSKDEECESWPDIEDKVLATVGDVAKVFSNRTASVLPKSASELAALPGGIHSLAFNTVSRRTTDWIIENGQCLDNIAHGLSTLSQAGRGGFARRPFLEGDLIAPVPLLQIVDRDTLTIYNFTTDEQTGEKGRVEEEVLGTQMLLNYCFGHEESSLLLCPQSDAILINHCSTRRPWEGECGEKGPNAAIRWATDWDPNTSEWLQMSLVEMMDKGDDERGLSLEIYALRNIQPGEEIFIDYGNDWEAAWVQHVANWEPPAKESIYGSYASTAKLNAMNMPLRTIDEEETNPYPKNVMTTCLYWEREEESSFWESQNEDLAQDWKKLSNEEILDRFSMRGHFYRRHSPTFRHENPDATYWPCKVYDQNGERGVLVRIYQLPEEETTLWTAKGLPRFLRMYPRDSVRFTHKPYTSDQHLPGAFRHHIGINDSIFPPHWKNRRRGDGLETA